MCLPFLAPIGLMLGAGAGAAAAVGTIATVSAIGTGLQVVGAVGNAKTQKAQLAASAANSAANAEVAKVNAALARKNIELAKNNAIEATDVAAGNANRLMSLTAANATARTNITDLNVALAGSISNFNTQIADGQAELLIGQGEVAGAVAERNARTAEYNAGLNEQSAQDALNQGNQQEQDSRLNYARLKSTQRVNLAANGVVLDEGSALRIQTDTDFFSDLDAQTIHANAVAKAFGYRGQETNNLIEAQSQRLGGKVAQLNARTQAFTVQAQAFGAKLETDRDILNMKLSTSFEIMQDNANAEIEAANILNEGRKEASGYEMQAAGFDADAVAYDAQAGNFTRDADGALVARDGISPFFSGATTLISGATQVAGKWYNYKAA